MTRSDKPHSRGEKLHATLTRLCAGEPPAALPDLVLAEYELDADETRVVTLERDAALGALVTTRECFDLDEVKNLIGLPNHLASRKTRYPRPRRASPNFYGPDELVRALEDEHLTPDMGGFIRMIGRQYVFGDSRAVREYKHVLERVYTRGAGRFDITAACFGTIRVRNGWSLVLGPSIQMFCAERILLEPEARVRRLGNADVSIDVSAIRVVEPELHVTI